MADKPKIITSGVVHVLDENGVRHSFRTGDTVPDWATVTNPALFAAAPTAPSTETTQTTTVSTETTTPPVNTGDTGGTSTEPPVKEPSQKELKEKAKSLGLATGGSKADIAARIAEHEATNAPAAPEAGEGEGDADREGLIARAKAAGNDEVDDLTDEELRALLDE